MLLKLQRGSKALQVEQAPSTIRQQEDNTVSIRDAKIFEQAHKAEVRGSVRSLPQGRITASAGRM